MEIEKENLYDVVVVGGGPAGLTAALYLARAQYRVVVVEKENFGGQITLTHEVVNYPGVERTSGKELTEIMRKQAESFGAEFLSAEVESLAMESDIKQVNTSRGTLHSFGVLLATGANPRMIGFPGEETFRGRGVAYCATCDGEFFTGKEVFVIGGGFAAAEEAVFLTKYASHVTVLVREEDFTCAKSVADQAKNHPKITVYYQREVVEVTGDHTVRTIRYRHNQTGEITEYKAPAGENIGVFVFAGYVPATSLVKGLAQLDPQGYILTDSNLETTVPGLYAAGDVCVKSLRQVVTAVGDGALAATELEKYAARLQQKTGKVPKRPQVQVKREKETLPASSGKEASNSLFDNNMLAQLNTLFSRMTSSLILELSLDDRPVSQELKSYMEELAALTDKLSVKMGSQDTDAPQVRILQADGSWTGLAFHGVPGGHEFSSFVLGLYNAAGPGQAIDEDMAKAISDLGPLDMKVLVSLSCTMCPELVIAAQRIASLNPNITAQVYDVNHFPALRDQYQVMSVPCLVVNDGEKITFGKKNLGQLVAYLQG